MIRHITSWFSSLFGGGGKEAGKQSAPDDKSDERPLFDLDFSQGKGTPARLYPSLEADKERLNAFAGKMSEVPTLPALWQELQGAFTRGESAKAICKLMREDPPLVGKLLAQANALGGKREIVDASQAIVRLGFPAVRSIAMHHFMSALHQSGPSPYPSSKLWRHAMSTSALATLIAKQIRGCDPAIAGTLGLLHDIGRIGINATWKHGIGGVAEPEQGYLQFEHDRFGFDHLQAGVLLARHWQLPEAIQEGILYHHHPAHSAPDAVPTTVRKEVLAVYLADLLSIYFDNGGGHDLIVPPHAGWMALFSGSFDAFAASRAVSKELWRVSCIAL